MNIITNLPEHCNMDDRVAAQCLINEREMA